MHWVHAIKPTNSVRPNMDPVEHLRRLGLQREAVMEHLLHKPHDETLKFLLNWVTQKISVVSKLEN